ncbi:MAG: LysM peptidoglycan-binding domain-containing protein [Clostridiales bacterium]|nr:LysM peptidoglycan-binding domain-containing protein [Clostridiales bacterium]
MSSKDKDNINPKQLFNEDMTKRLVKKILDDDIEDKKNNNRDNSDFNIEYEEYDSEQFDDEYDEYSYEDEYYDEDDEYEDYKPKLQKRTSPNTKESSRKRTTYQNEKTNYRKNIEKYGKEFFDDEYDEYDDNSPSIMGKVISFSIIIVLTISTSFLALSLISTKKEIEESKAKIQELLDSKANTESKIMEESLKNEIDSLKKENEDLKLQINPNSQNNKNDNTTQQTTKSSSNSNATNNNSNNSIPSEYIVKEGDVIWNISKKVYGNGSHFQKILDANGLKENSVLKPGQKLIIPKL